MILLIFFILGTGTYYTRQDTGYILNKHEYDAWGYNTKAATYNYDPEYRATEPYFTGHPYDGALNLYYAHNRFFDAQTGQWLSEDPIQDGLNWYQYCNSNPVSYVDVLGLSAENPEEGYYYVMEGSTGGWMLSNWHTGWDLLDNMHRGVFRWHTNLIAGAETEAAVHKQAFMDGTYYVLENTVVGNILNNGFTNTVMFWPNAYGMAYGAKYLYQGKGLGGSIKESWQNREQNLTYFYAGLAETFYDIFYWDEAKLTSIYKGAVEGWDAHPVKNVVLYSNPGLGLIYNVGSGVINTGDQIFNGTDEETGRALGNFAGELAIDVAAAAVASGISKAVPKVKPKAAKAIGVVDDVVEGGLDAIDKLDDVLTNKTLTNQTKKVDNYVSSIKGNAAAKADFDAMDPTNIRTYSNGTIAGDLPDGRTINIHPSTTLGGIPSVEIYDPITGKSIKIRY